MARRAITTDLYSAIVQAFREAPGNANRAAGLAGVDRRTAKRAWEEGWAPRYPPVRDVLKKEELEARAARNAAREAEARAAAAEAARLAESARKDAIEAKTQEAQLVKFSRGNAMLLLHASLQLLNGLQELATKVRTEMGKGQIDVKEATSLVRQVSMVVRQGVEAGETAMRMERLFLGEPTEVVNGPRATMSHEEALAEIEAAQDALASARARGVIYGDVLEDGGELDGVPELAP